MKNELDKLTITFVVTEDCNFRCKYCYMQHKNNLRRMPFSIAKAAVDLFLGNRDKFPQSAVVWEFIGGEPLLEIDLIDQIVDYIQLTAWEKNHPWFIDSMFSMSTNGSLYHVPKLQKLLDRYPSRFHVGVTVDGPPHVHNLERIFPNGQGTFDSVKKNLPAWMERFPQTSTKVTISPANLPYVAESVLYLFSIGFNLVNINCVFENVWGPDDPATLEAQLDLLGDEMIKQGHVAVGRTCSFFQNSAMFGNSIPSSENHNWCGAGKYMVAIDADGKLFPCVRFMDYSLSYQPEISIGDVVNGIDPEKLSPFLTLSRSCQSTEECLSCPVAGGCAWCQGFNYDDSGILNHRATYICQMHKARVRANARFQAKISERKK